MLTDLVALFPNLAKEGYTRTSLPTTAYNCVAYAFNDHSSWWEPDPYGLFSWPSSSRDASIRGWIELAEAHGYVRCKDGILEPGFEKIVIYVSNHRPTHVARQLEDGKWTSKLGELDDITHTLTGLEDSSYGDALRFLRRPRANPSSSKT
jgi:hypothetical protein